MSYIHLTIEERCCISKFYNEGKSIREIAKLIYRNPSIISRELKINSTVWTTGIYAHGVYVRGQLVQKTMK